MGGGLGHLTRARAFLRTLGLGCGAALFTSSPFARDRRVAGELEVVAVPDELDGRPAALSAFLSRTLAERRVRRLVVDALPAGILGELAGWERREGLELWHVARLLRWERYTRECGNTLPRFDVTFQVEELDGAHRRALEAASGEVRRLELSDPPSDEPGPLERPYVLVVHCGPREEVEELISYARDLLRAEARGARIVLASPSRPEALPGDVVWLDAYPVTGYLAGAERIVSAAGFNTMRQCAPFRSKHFFVPFPRRFDDPFARAARARAWHPLRS
jgi:hypothetical protein